MKKTIEIELDTDDVAKIIAKYYNVEPENVTVGAAYVSIVIKTEGSI